MKKRFTEAQIVFALKEAETGGELVVLAPGVTRFGEDEGIDLLMRKYGYVGSKKVLDLVKTNRDFHLLSRQAHERGDRAGEFSLRRAADNDSAVRSRPYARRDEYLAGWGRSFLYFETRARFVGGPGKIILKFR